MSVFAGKVCIVTGGASGIGAALVRRLVTDGATAIIADREVVDGAATPPNEAQGTTRNLHVDVTDPVSVEALVKEVLRAWGRIDYLFNNAGTAITGEVRDLSLADWRRVLEVNLFGVIHGIHYVYPVMVRQKSGHIVNVASGLGLVGGPTVAPYVASKFAVVGLSQSLRAEAHDLGVRVTTICPGFVQTPMIAGGNTINADDEKVHARTPKALVVTADDAARRILDGVARNKAVVAFPLYVHALVAASRLQPALLFRYSLKLARDFRLYRYGAP